MVCGQNFICLGNNMWESNYSNTVVELMHILSRENKVLYVDYPFTWKDLWESMCGKSKLPVKRIVGLETRLRKIKSRTGNDIHVLTSPPVLPIHKIRSQRVFRHLLKVNAGFVEAEIRAAASALGMDQPIMVSGFNPYYGTALAGKLGEQLNIYYCYDEIDAGWHKLHGPSVEMEYVKKTDIVITTSDYLFQKKKEASNACYVVKNGVDFEAFNRFAIADKEYHADRPKVVGYTGSIDSRFDTETVTYLIENLPQVQFIFAGRVTNPKAFERIRSYSNVSWLGSQKPEDVPAIVGQIDLGIVPYLKNELTEAVYPLKYNEYLAAGKPVVSTDFADLPEFRGYVNFASCKEDFLQAVREQLSGDNATKRSLRTRFAERNSWINRAEEFSAIIYAHLGKNLKNTLVYE